MALTDEFGRNVKKRREKLGLSQEKLADVADVHRTYLSAVESGKRNPTLLVVERLARALGVKAVDLIREDKA